jgi:hypothetical protein
MSKYWRANVDTDKTEWDAIWTTINKRDTKIFNNNLKRFMSVFIQKKLMADVDGYN